MKVNMGTNGILSIRVGMELAGNAVITVYNSIGSKVYRKSMELGRYVTNQLDLSKLSAGYYTLLYECNGKTAKEKFIKY